MGGQLRLVITGGAPITEKTYSFIKHCLCTRIYQGYGTTETSASVALAQGRECQFYDATIVITKLYVCVSKLKILQE